MKATGIIRRIDDLGRVVIPKEIRRTCNIREGDPLEIFLDGENDTICFKRYMRDPSEDIKRNFEQLIEDLSGEGLYAEAARADKLKTQVLNELTEICDAL